MRMHIEMDDRLVAEIDQVAGSRGRSAFVRQAVEAAVQQERRWAAIRGSAGAIEARGHDWDADPAAWVREQRHTDVRRAG